MTSVTVRAPAKVNLGLAVGPPRGDGFHDVATAYHAISLHDELVAAASDELTVSVTTADGVAVDDVPQDASNLAVAAALALAERTGVEPLARLHVTKAIPVAGGMAGGSADAAAALVACDALWQTGLPRAELLELAGGLGSDVPFSLVGGTALGTGRGEVLTPVLARGRFEWVVAVADGGLSTPAVYAECDRLRGKARVPEPRVSDALMAALRTGDAEALGAALHNDLQDAACVLRPDLRLTLETGADAGALGGMVSGSGPTVVFLARSTEHAIDIAVALSATGTCRSVRRAHGPVPGARLVGA
jgi:4-diphosphocytidyl-2-C-methyl-D-erythritol kinase